MKYMEITIIHFGWIQTEVLLLPAAHLAKKSFGKYQSKYMFVFFYFFPQTLPNIIRLYSFFLFLHYFFVLNIALIFWRIKEIRGAGDFFKNRRKTF